MKEASYSGYSLNCVHLMDEINLINSGLGPEQRPLATPSSSTTLTHLTRVGCHSGRTEQRLRPKTTERFPPNTQNVISYVSIFNN